ncbi:MAG TPA: hypothetical protein VKU02_27840, partial [Gemmataceae bacterium]|nr:hypothetical protein [Gemmataceae bacterium]
FIGQIGAVVQLRRERNRPRPYKMWLYPLPCILALVGWSYMYLTAAPLFIVLGLVTLLAGSAAFLLWAWRTEGWPFGTKEAG